MALEVETGLQTTFQITTLTGGGALMIDYRGAWQQEPPARDLTRFTKMNTA